MRTYFQLKSGRLDEVKGEVVREQPLTVYVDGERFLTLLCSPFELDALVLGYLWMEKVIGSLDEVSELQISEVDGRADVTLRRPVTLPTERILTSGCGGGITFRIDPRLFPRIVSDLRVRPAELGDRMRDLIREAVHYRASRGIHGAALADRDRVLLVAEDVGRHNAVDKIMGLALQRGITTTDRILLSTGRVSSEMLLKAARMGVPVVASRTSPTEMAVALAEQLGVTVVGYLRGDEPQPLRRPRARAAGRLLSHAGLRGTVRGVAGDAHAAARHGRRARALDLCARWLARLAGSRGGALEVERGGMPGALGAGVPLLAEAVPVIAPESLEDLLGPVMERLAAAGPDDALALGRFAEAWDAGRIGPAVAFPGLRQGRGGAPRRAPSPRRGGSLPPPRGLPRSRRFAPGARDLLLAGPRAS